MKRPRPSSRGRPRSQWRLSGGGRRRGGGYGALVITDTTFASEDCANSGALQLDADGVVMIVQKSSCPGTVNVGSVVTCGFTVEDEQLRIVNTKFGAEVCEVYRRQD